MLQTTSLVKRFSGLYAVRDLSFSVAPGEILGLLGPNGSGKSTTVKMITGLLAPTSGDVAFQGVSVKSAPDEYKRMLGYVPEVPDLYTFLSGREYLELIGGLRNVDPELLDRKIRRLLELFSLGSDGGARIASYSKGMRQKILVAAALLDDPPYSCLTSPYRAWT